MKKEIVYAILGALLFLALVVVAWVWFFNHSAPTPQTNGTFGSAQNKPGTTNTPSSTGGNGQIVLPSQGSNTGATGPTWGPGTQVVLPNSGSTGTYTPLTNGTVGNGGIWLGSSNIPFTPSPINGVANANINGLPDLNQYSSGLEDGSNNGIDLTTALLGAGIGAAACTTGLLPTGTAVTGFLSSLGLSSLGLSVTVNDPVQNAISTSDNIRDNFLNCVVRGIARAAIDQITASTVDWINGGFNGSPAFIQDFNQFFTNVADQAAGQFIQGSGLAFLCSPFQLRVKIAIAQSYAHRNNAPSCTLSQVIGNVNGFMNGDFAQGGWPGLISITTMPTNNAYGAYMYGEVELANAQGAAIRVASQKISPGGFLSSEKCTPAASGVGPPDCKITTPGSVIEDSLNSVTHNSLTQLDLAKNFDEILSALVTQLMTRTLYSGLSNLSGQNGYAASAGVDPVAQAAAETLLTNLQTAAATAQQYGTTEQGSVSDVQNAQRQINTLQNCWATVASSTTISAGRAVQAQNNANGAAAQITALEGQVTAYNNRITMANGAIALVQQLQSQALSATSLDDVNAVTTQLNQAVSTGGLVTPSDVTAAQQDRATLQSQLGTLNTATTNGLAQCYAFGQ